MENGNISTLFSIKISFDAAWNKMSQKSGGYKSNSKFTNVMGISKKMDSKLMRKKYRLCDSSKKDKYMFSKL
mgnify:CR=1 FL=1